MQLVKLIRITNTEALLRFEKCEHHQWPKRLLGITNNLFAAETNKTLYWFTVVFAFKPESRNSVLHSKMGYRLQVISYFTKKITSVRKIMKMKPQNVYLFVGHEIVSRLETRMYDVDKSHRQSGRDVEERDGQQHQSGRSFRRLLHAFLGHRAATSCAVQLPTASPAGADESSDDKDIENDGGQRCNKVECHLGRPHVDFGDCRLWPLGAAFRVTVVRVDVRVE